MSGFGSDKWGSYPWGEDDDTRDVEIAESPSFSESLLVSLQLKVLYAEAVSLTEVDVFFSHGLDPSYTAQFLTTNFSFTPALTVSAVQVLSPKRLRLTTDYQSPVQTYLLEVGVGRSLGSDPLDPSFDTATVAGMAITPSFSPQAQAIRTVTVTFSQPALNNSGLTNPANYSLTDLEGNAVSVLAVVPGPVVPIRVVTLTLGADLEPWAYYALSLALGVQTTTAIPFQDTRTFQWMDNAYAGPIQVAATGFSGEISGGLHGNPLGQVFFSPALENGISGSSIQVESVEVCTRAEDSYSMPDLPDPNVFMLESAPLDNPGFVLFAPAWQLGLVNLALAMVNADSLPTPQDALMDVRLVEPIDITRGGFLDDARWALFDGIGAPFMLYSDISPSPDPGPASFTIQPSDMVDVTDQISTLGSFVRTTTDAVTASDSISREEGRTVSDSVTVTDTGSPV